ncbi:DNA polymerase III subunit delta [Prolixibacteraceae bacterium JC049]|nr:DNA polymerase III subunit delta [Prolixibacteraceae bacterium JC049]
MQFKDIIGQEATKKQLRRSVLESRISHAQMFYGTEGVGKLALAIAYAQYISCANRTEEDSCGQCPSCKKYEKLIHPDLHFVYPVVKTPKYKDPVSDHFLNEWRETIIKEPYFNIEQWFDNIGVENAQGMIYSHESDEIIRKLSLKTFEGEYKVMIIWLPEKMHVVASNKLLKMIEEPPSKTLFLLISEDLDKIIGTIRSRTQLVKVGKIDDQSMLEAIQRWPETANYDVNKLVHLAGGNLIQARNLLLKDEHQAYYFQKFVELMRLTYSRKLLELFDWVDEVSAVGRERQKLFLNYSLRLIRENFILNFKQPDMSYLSNEEMNFSQKFSPFINERNVIKISEELERAHQHISMNGNGRIIFMDLALKVVKLIRL